jgi:flagellar P-ring protein precursor FlgI
MTPHLSLPLAIPLITHYWAIVLLITLFTNTASASGLKIGEICRLKGQETNTLQGLGLVVGLRGTGDGDAAPTGRALARMMQLMGGPMSIDRAGQLNLDDVSDAKNVAMVFVTATVPGTGAQPGDQMDVRVNAINAKSLEGGTLMLTPLLGPRADNPTVYAMAQGKLNVAVEGPVTTATIQGGAKMEAAVQASFHANGKITLVVEKDFASFATAQRIETEINNQISAYSLGDPRSGPSGRTRARAIDQIHVEVEIPELYRANPIKFISLVLDTPITLANQGSRVVINEEKGIVVIGEDVEIAPVLVTHRNLSIDVGTRSRGLVPVNDVADEPTNAKLKSLHDALNALDVPTEDLIEIIKTLKRKGDLYGQVIFQ